jgi:hypothetical protein
MQKYAFFVNRIKYETTSKQLKGSGLSIKQISLIKKIHKQGGAIYFKYHKKKTI